MYASYPMESYYLQTILKSHIIKLINGGEINYITFEGIKIQLSVQLPVGIVYDGPDPPACPMTFPYCLVVWPKVSVVVYANSQHHENSYGEETKEILELNKDNYQNTHYSFKQ